MSRILGREGANVQVSGTLFKAVDQAVLLFGSKTWAMAPCMGRDGGGQHRVACRLTGKQIQHLWYRSWYYPPLEELVREAGLEKVEEYFLKRYNTFIQYITGIPIINLCEEVV